MSTSTKETVIYKMVKQASGASISVVFMLLELFAVFFSKTWKGAAKWEGKSGTNSGDY